MPMTVRAIAQPSAGTVWLPVAGSVGAVVVVIAGTVVVVAGGPKTSARGPRLVADTGGWGTFSWTKFVLGAPGNHIAVGTDETVKNIIGERVLGLPKEPIDRTTTTASPRVRSS